MARGGPSWLRLRRRRRAARKAEDFIAGYEFPSHVGRRVKRKLELDDLGWLQVEQGLREWFVCCAWRGTRMVGMPSRAVDEAWHEFILDSVAYSQFCQAAFGEYLHHTPDEAMPGSGTELPDLNAETVRAWDRSAMGARGDSVLWDLDARLGLAAPLGVGVAAVEAARTRSPYPLASGWACGGGFWGGDGGGSGGEAGSGEDGGDSGGGGCSGGGGDSGGGSCGGGGGCGGGGCGGGS